MVKYIFIGTGETDANGVARLTEDPNGQAINGYTGDGSGKINFVASTDNPITSSSIISGTLPIFDCPVYDGDNIPVSINFSKTNNAVVTDEVVSLIASVKNTNNNPCINIPVVFKRGNTVLGTAYTDCTGDATITQVWVDSDIFDITAAVGQSLSEDLTMFVKDKTNILELYSENNQKIIQTGNTIQLIAFLTDNQGQPQTNKRINFYETFTPTINLTTNTNIIQTGETLNLQATLKDGDGSLVKGEKIKFYKEE